jgi:hypothetical protein
LPNCYDRISLPLVHKRELLDIYDKSKRTTVQFNDENKSNENICYSDYNRAMNTSRISG